MSRPFTVGLTGGIACGKTVVAGAFMQHGVDIIDADQIARDIVEPGSPALAEIEQCFGAHVIGADGALLRRALRGIIFKDDAARADLEAITHPRIRTELARRRDAASSEYCMLAIPLLVKSGMGDLVDRLLVIDAPEKVQLERLIARDDIDEDLAYRMIHAQDTRKARLEAADDVLLNTGPRKDIADLAAALHAGYSRHASGEIADLPPMYLPG